MTVVATDTFDRANQVGLGGSWTEHSGTWAISGNTATLSAAPGVASLPGAAGDIVVTAPVVVPSSGDLVLGIAARLTDATSFVGAEIVRTTGEQKVIAFRRVGGTDREIGSVSHTLPAGTYTLALTVSGRNVRVEVDGVAVLVARLTDTEDAAITGTAVGLIGFNAPAGNGWSEFTADDAPAAVVVPALNADFDTTADVGWLESGASINGWHSFSSVWEWQVTSDQAAQQGTNYQPVMTMADISDGIIGVDVAALGDEFWLLHRMRDSQSYIRVGRSGGGNYALQKIVNDSVQPLDGLTTGATLAPQAGDRIEIAEMGAAGAEYYVVRAGTPTQIFSHSDTDLGAYADQVGFAAFNSAALRFDNLTYQAAVAPSAVDLTPAAATVTATVLDPQPAAVTVDLAPATLTAAAVELDPQPQPAAVTLTAARATAGAAVLTPAPGPGTVALVAATVTVTARQLVGATEPSAIIVHAVTGPARSPDHVTGPGRSHAAAGPHVARTVTGPGV